MGFLNKKNRIIDFCLTEKGRDLLAQNKLRIQHFAFSDDLMDYSGSLDQAVKTSASFDDVVYKNFVPIEASSMAGGRSSQRDLTSFLYTCPEQRNALPPFRTNVSGSNTLTRTYTKMDFDDFVANSLPNLVDTEVVITTTRDETAVDDREKQYAAQQDVKRLADEDPFFVNIVK